MELNYKNKNYEINIIKKNNKHTYIRVTNGKIIITTNYFASKRYINNLIKESYSDITKMIDKYEEQNKQNEKFLIFGKEYNLIYDKQIKEIKIIDNNIYVKDEKQINKYLDKLMKETFIKHLYDNYEKYKENIPKPTLRLRDMKTRWGVCNTKTKVITLNKKLIRYDIECLDYVCIHELSHLIEANHSRKFWNIVEKYMPNYKEIRKKLK